MLPFPINLMEEAVDQIIDEIIAQENACTCQKCRMDSMALTLNQLRPRYVVSEQGNAFAAVAANLQQSRVDVYKTTLEAVRRVNANPQH